MEENELVGQSKDNKKPTQNIFQIMEEIVRQLNRTKKVFVVMIVSVIVAVPLTFIVTFALLGGVSSGTMVRQAVRSMMVIGLQMCLRLT